MSVKTEPQWCGEKQTCVNQRRHGSGGAALDFKRTHDEKVLSHVSLDETWVLSCL